MPRLRNPELQLRARVGNGLVEAAGHRLANTVFSTHHDDVEYGLARHVGIRALARAEGQRTVRVRPGDGRRGVRSALVVVVVALVGVEREAAIPARVDAQFDRAVRLLVGIFLFWSERQ